MKRGDRRWLRHPLDGPHRRVRNTGPTQPSHIPRGIPRSRVVPNLQYSLEPTDERDLGGGSIEEGVLSFVVGLDGDLRWTVTQHAALRRRRELWLLVQARYRSLLEHALRPPRGSQRVAIRTHDQVDVADLAWGFVLRWQQPHRSVHWQNRSWRESFETRCNLEELSWILACEQRVDWREPTRMDRLSIPDDCLRQLHLHLDGSVQEALRSLLGKEHDSARLSTFAWCTLWSTHLGRRSATPYCPVATLRSWLVVVAVREAARDHRVQDASHVGTRRTNSAIEAEESADGCFRALPPKCRLVLSLWALEGLSERQIALHLRASEHTVRELIERGMRVVRPYYRARGGGGSEAGWPDR